jgi:uracil phosphoribosyltransferase
MKDILITKLRNATTSRAEFRATAYQLSLILAHEISAHLRTKQQPVRTPIATTTGTMISDQLVIIPILRSGLIMLQPFLTFYPDAAVGFVGMRRDEKTAIPKLYYQNLPPIKPNNHVIIVDPMLATGGTATETLNILKKQGITGKQIIFVGIICAPEGLNAVRIAHPDVTFTIAITDQGLTPNFFITPGLGDFGDRYFGTE